MKTFLKHISILIVGLILTLPTSVFSSTDQQTQNYRATVIRIIDGDSIKIRHNGEISIVRLYGIDSPEWKQPFSRKARLYLEKLLLGTDIQVKAFYADKFSRTVALINYQGNIVNQLLVEKGLAWVHIYYCHMEVCESWKKLEQRARTEKIGLWREKNPIPPWVWKRTHQK